MNSILAQISGPPPISFFTRNPKTKNGFLTFCILFMGFQIWWIAALPASYSGNRYLGLVVGAMLLLNHLSFSFWFGPRFTVFVRLLALLVAFGGLAFGIYSVMQNEAKRANKSIEPTIHSSAVSGEARHD